KAGFGHQFHLPVLKISLNALGRAGVGAESDLHAGIDQLLENLLGHFKPVVAMRGVRGGGQPLLQLRILESSSVIRRDRGSGQGRRVCAETEGAKNGSLSSGLGLAKTKVEASRVSVAAACHAPCFFMEAMSASSTSLSRTLCASPSSPASTSAFASER